jgi:hypothetical protein
MIKLFDQVGECRVDLGLSQMTKLEWANHPNYVLFIVPLSGALSYLSRARSQVEPPYKEGSRPNQNLQGYNLKATDQAMAAST